MVASGIAEDAKEESTSRLTLSGSIRQPQHLNKQLGRKRIA
jgi:hypothetical protein